MNIKKIYVKPALETVESEKQLLFTFSIEVPDAPGGEDADGFMSKEDEWEEWEPYSADSWRKENLWDTNLWD